MSENLIDHLGQFCPVQTYLGVKLDRSLTFRHHLKTLRKKLTLLVALLRRLMGSGWGTDAKILSVSAICPRSLVYSTTKYGIAHQPGVIVLILASLTVFSMTPLDVYVPLQQTTYQF